ncbi:MAG TPA: chemotaxis protein CheD [Spirochaetota bacterium]|nr:chemotaxis protein CheD [Spirochaetota bacterium]HOS33883.1 chemotaxis protein CheD [Spirochaetota bacterium]HOS33894.1 chemotaxis protein CheD [Spirochaetota bacterium]HOS56864.1 chemotaxis protein CheD [Spirochaetota bacterium]HPK62192.1 chemotaxis protein CheD [Spirochaetota bacterium]
MNKPSAPHMQIVPIGGLFVTDKDMIIQTVLGSCVATTLFDVERKIAGMNHILLPGTFHNKNVDKMLDEKDLKYGIFSMEKLISGVLNLGARKESLEARIYGGSFVNNFNQFLEIQKNNVEFVKEFLKMSKIKIVEEITMQNEALKILLWTSNGKVEISRLPNINKNE